MDLSFFGSRFECRVDLHPPTTPNAQPPNRNAYEEIGRVRQSRTVKVGEGEGVVHSDSRSKRSHSLVGPWRDGLPVGRSREVTYLLKLPRPRLSRPVPSRRRASEWYSQTRFCLRLLAAVVVMLRAVVGPARRSRPRPRLGRTRGGRWEPDPDCRGGGRGGRGASRLQSPRSGCLRGGGSGACPLVTGCPDGGPRWAPTGPRDRPRPVGRERKGDPEVTEA